MKKIALAAAAASLLLTGAASAADMAPRYTKAPPPVVAPIYNWTGFYIGINGGGGWADKCWDIFNDVGFPIAPFREGCHTASGGTVGGQIGYRWQAAQWVFGLEAQGNWADFKGSNASLFFAPGAAINRTKVDAFGLFTGQVGYAWNNFLWYVKGGAAVTNDKYEGIIGGTGIVFDRAEETRWGAAVGTGIEYGFGPGWSLGIEYNHLFMGHRDINLTFVAAPGVLSRGETIRQDVDIVTARINYRFGGPIVAKY
ncbi:outer membrane beta-barrel protein [Bradyrhizobium lablabi]|uniref:outer membrane protein n=1 Tax=Bradyrhizobium lablabi TaxID=722472 RepID=UPI001BACF150|nr:outer membrane beta-barrel protein [Bradyrhizobium lablabi]MBR1124630.1 outer membrane beta-barrel protein [Bradyrhizobium lablabi]